MRSLKITHNLIRNVIWDMFPNSGRLGWVQETISLGYFGRGDEEFCCVGDKWWRVTYRDTRYLISTEEGYGSYTFLASAKKVEPPTDVVYSHTEVYQWENDADPTEYMGQRLNAYP